MRINALAIGSVAALLGACGGGDGGAGPPPAPAPVPPVSKASLSSNNYQHAVKLPMDVGGAAYRHAKLGVDIVDRWLNEPVFPVVSCPGGGTMTISLTDRNADRTLDPLDTIHFRWERCRLQDTTTSGVVRVELREATPLEDGREYQLTITVADLRVERDGQSSATVDYIAQVHATQTSTYRRIEVSNAVFDSGQVVGDTGTSTLAVDYLQNGATQTYQYSVSGTVSSGELGGEVEFTTPTAFSGVIGEYPSVGRLQVAGNANSGARLAEEGPAAGDTATVRVDLDANGDGVIDASEAQLAWADVVPVQLFAAYPDQPAIDVPMP
jgi:hypothetical protein